MRLLTKALNCMLLFPVASAFLINIEPTAHEIPVYLIFKVHIIKKFWVNYPWSNVEFQRERIFRFEGSSALFVVYILVLGKSDLWHSAYPSS